MDLIICPDRGVMCAFGGSKTKGRIYAASDKEAKELLSGLTIESRIDKCQNIGKCFDINNAVCIPKEVMANARSKNSGSRIGSRTEVD